MSPTDLCQLPPEPAGGCCDPQTAPAAVPLSIENPAGLSAIGYRIGTFTSFRRTMLDRVTGAGGVATSPPVPAPFANWHEGADGDYQTIFIELWAYLTDILTFYQERIANEAYIGTATQSDSSRLLAQLVDYRPSRAREQPAWSRSLSQQTGSSRFLRDSGWPAGLSPD